MGIVHGNSSPITTDHHESVHIFSVHQYLQFAQTHENENGNKDKENSFRDSLVNTILIRILSVMNPDEKDLVI